MSNKQNEQVTTPMGAGGLMRFNDEYPSKLTITPEWVTVIIVAVIVGIAALKLMLKI